MKAIYPYLKCNYYLFISYNVNDEMHNENIRPLSRNNRFLGGRVIVVVYN